MNQWQAVFMINTVAVASFALAAVCGVPFDGLWIALAIINAFFAGYALRAGWST